MAQGVRGTGISGAERQRRWRARQAALGIVATHDRKHRSPDKGDPVICIDCEGTVAHEAATRVVRNRTLCPRCTRSRELLNLDTFAVALTRVNNLVAVWDQEGDGP